MKSKHLWKIVVILIVGVLLAMTVPLSASGQAEASPADTYNRQAAYDYAQKYWDEVCSDGYFWDTPGTYISLEPETDITGMTGYDCAHFVSCCIGSEPNEPGGGLDVPSRVPPTYGEPGAAKLGDWLIESGNAVEKTAIDELDKGDVINYDWDGDGHWDHVALYLGDGKVAAHTSCVWEADWQLDGADEYRFIHINVSDSQTIAPGTLGYASARKLARTSDGVLHCVYRRLDGSYFQIYHAYSTNGGQTWSEEQITTASRNHSCPSIAVDSNDHIHVVWAWYEEPYGFGKTCTVQYRVKTGTWQPIEDVITSYGYVCSIAVDRQDNIHLVVGGYNPGGYSTDYVKYLKRTLSGWSSPEKVSPKVWANFPAIAIDQNNYVHVVFRTAPYYEPLCGLYYRQRTADGWQSEETIQPPDQERSPASVALDSSGNLYVVWANYDTQCINIRKRTSSGWEATEEVWHESGYRQSNPTIAIDSNDYLHVVWAGKHLHFPDYYQLRYRKYTTGWSSVQNLTSASLDQKNPNLIWAWWPSVEGIRTNVPKDGYAFIWQDNETIRFYKSSDLAWETPVPSVSIETDKTKYWVGDTMNVTINITSPANHTFEWYIGIPQFDIWTKVASVPLPAEFDNSYTIPIPVGDWGNTSFGIVHYVHLLDPDNNVVVTDMACCDYQTHPLPMKKAMSVDVTEEIRKEIERVEFLN